MKSIQIQGISSNYYNHSNGIGKLYTRGKIDVRVDGENVRILRKPGSEVMTIEDARDLSRVLALIVENHSQESE